MPTDCPTNTRPHRVESLEVRLTRAWGFLGARPPSGYQAAVLSPLVEKVYTIEIIPELAERAREVLQASGCENVEVLTGDGFQGLPKHAPFDGIIVTAAPPEVPEPLLEQLGLGGRLVIPVGEWKQELKVLERTEEGIQTRTLFRVQFVPMKGEAQQTR